MALHLGRASSVEVNTGRDDCAQSPGIDSQDLENGEAHVDTFYNRDVHSLAWQNLQVTVKSKQGTKPKTILSGITGIAHQGT